MCFSNLPIEFDEAGDPYLADDADEVEHVTDCGCETDVAIEEDPGDVFEAVVSSVPDSVRLEIGSGTDDVTDVHPRDDSSPTGRTDERADGD